MKGVAEKEAPQSEIAEKESIPKAKYSVLLEFSITLKISLFNSGDQNYNGNLYLSDSCRKIKALSEKYEDRKANKRSMNNFLQENLKKVILKSIAAEIII